MKELEETRERIASVDEQMARLFEERMNLSATILECKVRSGLPVYDPEQEAKVLAAGAGRMQDPVKAEYYTLFQKAMMGWSKAYQTRLMAGMKVAYSGVKGAFADIAVNRLFPDAGHVACPDFDSAYAACEKGEADAAVLPLENSTAGVVGRVMDLCFSGSLYINNVSDLCITQNLLGIKGSRLSDIRKVVSHPQALFQCGSYISSHGFETQEYANTASAAEMVAKLGDKTVAAIASAETAELYGLEILEKDISASHTNTTRFATFSRSMHQPLADARDESFILVFTVKDEAGALAKALNIIGANGFNMSSLHSRPLEGPHWRHYFFAELEGNARGSEGQDLLRQLATVCARVKLVGCFRRG